MEKSTNLGNIHVYQLWEERCRTSSRRNTQNTLLCVAAISDIGDKKGIICWQMSLLPVFKCENKNHSKTYVQYFIRKQAGSLSVILRGLWEKNVGCFSLSHFYNVNSTAQYLLQHDTLVRQNVLQIKPRPDLGAQKGSRDLAQVPAPRLQCLNLCLAITSKGFLTNKPGNNSFAFTRARPVSISCELSSLA